MTPASFASPPGPASWRAPGRESARETAPARARPTLRAVLFFSASIPLALVIVTGLREFWHLSLYLPGAVLALMAADLTMSLPGRRLRADLSCPSRLQVGQEGSARCVLSVQGSARPMVIEGLLEYGGDRSDLTDPPVPVSVALPAPGRESVAELEFPLAPRRRGRLPIAALWLRWRGPLGLMGMRRRQNVGKTVDIVPDVRGMNEAALRFFARDAAHGMKNQRLRGEGTEYDSLCEYAQGMDIRFMDWKRSARHRKLLCKEFRQERNHPVMLAFDAGHLMLEPVERVSRLDHAVKAGLVLARISLHSGDLVGGCGFGARFRSFIKPGRGMPYFAQFQRFTAHLDYREEETNFTLGLAELNRRLNRRSLVVLFTEFVDTVSAELLLESLQWMARRHVVVFVTLRDPMTARLTEAPPEDFAAVARSVIADGFVRERAIVLERIARLGVHCLDVPSGGLTTTLLNRYLLIKQRGLL